MLKFLSHLYFLCESCDHGARITFIVQAATRAGDHTFPKTNSICEKFLEFPQQTDACGIVQCGRRDLYVNNLGSKRKSLPMWNILLKFDLLFVFFLTNPENFAHCKALSVLEKLNVNKTASFLRSYYFPFNVAF